MPVKDWKNWVTTLSNEVIVVATFVPSLIFAVATMGLEVVFYILFADSTRLPLLSFASYLVPVVVGFVAGRFLFPRVLVGLAAALVPIGVHFLLLPGTLPWYIVVLKAGLFYLILGPPWDRGVESFYSAEDS